MTRKIKTYSHLQGFSLIELLTVVAIIAILSAIAIPQYMKYVKKSRTSEAVSNLGAIAMYEETYFSESDTYVTADANPTGAPPSPADPGGRKNFSDTVAGWSLLGRVIPNATPLYFQYEVRAGQYKSAPAGAFNTGGTGRLVDPTVAVVPGGAPTAAVCGIVAKSANNLSIPSTASSNWFYATAVGNQTPNSTDPGKCSLFIKVIDRHDVYSENELQ